jgi:hypothetical protein
MGCGFESAAWNIFLLQCRISEWALMSISEHFRYRNDVFQSDIFVTDIGITDVDVGCQISPILRTMSMSTYGYELWYKLQASSYKLWTMSFEIQVTSYELISVTWKILAARSDDTTVWYLDRSMIVRCKIVPYIDRIQLSRLICAGCWLYSTVQVLYRKIISRQKLDF